MINLQGMNGSQREAVIHGQGPLLLLAGPGSGKTFTITNRILYLMEQGISPEKILVITFAREAALSMQSRFQSMAPSVSPVNFGTFHSVFYHILLDSNACGRAKLLGSSERQNLMIPILKKYKAEDTGQSLWEDTREDAMQILSAVSFYKNTCRLEDAREKLPLQWQKYFEQILEEYGQRVKSGGWLDFDDMLWECRELLKARAGIRRRWQERFSHILIDEFQDINPVQYEVVKLLTREPFNIFAVGDDDQSIYGFRGSWPECMRRFVKEFGAKKLLLDVNYRSNQQIIDAALAVIGENRDRFQKVLRQNPARMDQGDCNSVRHLSFPGREEEYRYLEEQLERFARQQGREGRTCVVLFRTNSYMQGLAVRLRRLGISFQMNKGTRNPYSHFVAGDVMAYLRLAGGKWNRTDVLRVMNRPSRYLSREAVGSSRTIGEMAEYYRRQEIPQGDRKGILDALQLFGRHLSCMGRLSPSLAVTYLERAVGYGKWLRQTAGSEERRLEWMEVLEWMKEDAAGYNNVQEWEEAQKEYGAFLETGKGNRFRQNGAMGPETRSGQFLEAEVPCIYLMTVHASKGLEFDKVWIPDCNENVFPYGKLLPDSVAEEERRVFYVGMTRAKESLELLSLTGTRERPRQISRFLCPLSYLSSSPSTSSSNSALSRNSSKASATFSYSSSSAM